MVLDFTFKIFRTWIPNLCKHCAVSNFYEQISSSLWRENFERYTFSRLYEVGTDVNLNLSGLFSSQNKCLKGNIFLGLIYTFSLQALGVTEIFKNDFYMKTMINWQQIGKHDFVNTVEPRYLHRQNPLFCVPF